MTEILIILVLILLNGLFSMSEAALIASRKARLQQQAERGNRRARSALKLAENPGRFLSTVQIGITLIGIIAGAFGGATIATLLEAQLVKIEAIAPYASALSFTLVIAVTTYLSLILGELVPKRVALRYPERIAMLVAIPMRSLSKAVSPLVSLLTTSTEVIVRLLGIREDTEPPVTHEEIQTMMQQGVDAGVFEIGDHDMVEEIFKLSARRAEHMMTPRTEIVWLDINDDASENQQKILTSALTRFPVCDGDLDHVLGMIDSRTIFARCLRGDPFDVSADLEEPLYVPETLAARKLLDLFKANTRESALVINEYGSVQGLVTIRDMLLEIVGDSDDDDVVVRDDGSWLLDGLLGADEVKEALDLDDDLPGANVNFQTLGGFIMTHLGHIPHPADSFEWNGLRFEVMDMDGNRVDKVLVNRISAPAREEPAPEPAETE